MRPPTSSVTASSKTNAGAAATKTGQTNCIPGMAAVLPQHILDQLTKKTRSTTNGGTIVTTMTTMNSYGNKFLNSKKRKKVSARDEGLSMLLSELQESAPNLHPLVNENSLRKTTAATAASTTIRAPTHC